MKTWLGHIIRHEGAYKRVLKTRIPGEIRGVRSRQPFIKQTYTYRYINADVYGIKMSEQDSK